jgi:hypothetical protein
LLLIFLRFARVTHEGALQIGALEPARLARPGIPNPGRRVLDLAAPPLLALADALQASFVAPARRATLAAACSH